MKVCNSNKRMHILNLVQKMKLSITDFFSKCDQIRSFLRLWSHLLKKSLMKNFIFCTLQLTQKDNPQKISFRINYINKRIRFSWRTIQKYRLLSVNKYLQCTHKIICKASSTWNVSYSLTQPCSFHPHNFPFQFYRILHISV